MVIENIKKFMRSINLIIQRLLAQICKTHTTKWAAICLLSVHIFTASEKSTACNIKLLDYQLLKFNINVIMLFNHGIKLQLNICII